jgi:hypothetical protein
MTADFSLDACMESVKFDVEFFHKNPFEELGRAIIRAEQDVFFNKTMIDAWKKYIAENGLTWERTVA